MSKEENKSETKPFRVWKTFSSTKLDGTLLNFRIQDMPSDRYEDVMEMWLNHYIREESFHKASGLGNNKEAARKLFEDFFSDPSLHAVLCFLEDGSDKEAIAGISLMGVSKESDNSDDFDLGDIGEIPEIKKLFGIFDQLGAVYDFDKKFNLNEYYDDRGLFVHSDYRGHGIARELFDVRRLVSEAHGYPMTNAWMTSFGSQKAAARAGWETVFEIDFQEFGKLCDVTFKDVPPTLKLMIAKSNI